MEQSAFVKGRSILDSILIANELVEDVKRKRSKCFIFKADFEKAFVSVRWRFMFDILKCMGFGSKWMKWMESCLHSASISVLVNESPTREFNLQKGVRQGDPLSPFLLIIASEGLNILSNITVRDGLIRGVNIGKDNVRVSHLQFADDTIFFGDWGYRNASSIHKTLSCFEKVSGLRINMSKSQLFRIGVTKADIISLALKFGCGWRFRTETESLWVKIIKSIYGRDGGLGQTSTINNNIRGTVWRNIISIGPDLFNIGLYINSLFEKELGDGRDTLFWKDMWVGNFSLKDIIPRLFRLECKQEAQVLERVSCQDGSWSFSWCWSRALTGRLSGKLEQFTTLIKNNAIPGAGITKWRWVSDNSGSYNSKFVASKIDELCIERSSTSHETMRNYLLPQKIGISYGDQLEVDYR
ncbi:uncharacterized protein [Rutidosis leptorrhynchoides]|uniref:uncharacterized protein n=1 Tax=Rutidosis leptorrhynchoides TaxID=125765 RepID=UPI003A99B106